MNKLEVCCNDLLSVVAAKEGGADRIELCSALELGGLTPSIGLIKSAVEIFGKAVFVLIRERPGNFIYSDMEIEVMSRDVKAAVEAGVGGVVIGALTPSLKIDSSAIKKMMEHASEVEVTFHRAFDEVKDPESALNEIIDLGCQRLLTSGQAKSALDGIAVIKKLNDIAGGRITILPGAGVDHVNAPLILKATGAVEIHASAKETVNGYLKTNPDLVRKIKNAIS